MRSWLLYNRKRFKKYVLPHEVQMVDSVVWQILRKFTMSEEPTLSECDRAWLEHICSCGMGCLSTLAKTNDLGIQTLVRGEVPFQEQGSARW